MKRKQQLETYLNQLRKQLQFTSPAVLSLLALLLLFEVSFRLNQTIYGLLFSLNLPFGIAGLLAYIALVACVNIPLILAETFSPRTKNKPRYLQGAKYWLTYIVFNSSWAAVAAEFVSKTQPLFVWNIQEKLDSLTSIVTVGVGLLLPVLLYDFFYYWFHRAQHRFAFLWRFHKVHHSINNINCINSYSHFTEDLFRFPVIVLPSAFLMKVTAPQMFILSAFISSWGHFLHSDTSINLGKLNLVFADNVYHRIHHSVEERHFDKNFAAFFPLWDILFGTFCQLEDDKLPAVGLSDTAPPRSVVEYVLMPFKIQKNTQKFVCKQGDLK